jgi:hypothetical protein
VQPDRRQADPGRDEIGDELPGERPRGTRHLRAAGFLREHRLIALDRPSAGHVVIGDRRTVPRQVAGHVERQVDLSPPQATP